MSIWTLCSNEFVKLISLPMAGSVSRSVSRSVSSQSIDDPDDDADDESDNNCPQERLTIIHFTSGVTTAVILLNPRRLYCQEDQPYNDNNNDEPQDGPCEITTISLFMVMVTATVTHIRIHARVHARGETAEGSRC